MSVISEAPLSARAENSLDINNSQIVDSSLQSVCEEIESVLERIAAHLDSDADEPEQGTQWDEAIAKQLAADLQQIGSVLAVAEVGEGALLLSHLRTAFERLMKCEESPTELQRQAIFESSLLLSRYLAFVNDARQQRCKPIPAVLAPSFYSLARAGLAPFVDESELAGINLLMVSPEESGETLTEHDLLAVRRLRKMYQVGLIGLLRASSVSEQLKLIDRVAERGAYLFQVPLASAVWNMLRALIKAFENDQLQLTPQRRHFFARFDRVLKAMQSQQSFCYETVQQTNCLKELAYLLELAGEREYVDQQISQYVQLDQASWTEQQVLDQRKSIECGLKDSLLAMSDAVTEKLAEVKQRLSVMSESEVCGDDDVEYLLNSIDSLSAILKFCGFDQPATALANMRPAVAKWTQDLPGQSELLALADAILVVENALLCYALGSVDGSVSSSESLSLEEGLTHQAHRHLFQEMQANISLANRAISSYIEAEYDREHIANVANCLKATVGAFKMIGLEPAAKLMESCAALLEREYQDCAGGQHSMERLESLADSLVSTEYLLNELNAGRSMEGAIAQLIEQNLEVIDSELAA